MSARFGQWRRGRVYSVAGLLLRTQQEHGDQQPQQDQRSKEDQRPTEERGAKAGPHVAPSADNLTAGFARLGRGVHEDDPAHDQADANTGDRDLEDHPSRSRHYNLGAERSRKARTVEAEVLNAEEVAVFLRVDRKTVYEYANRGRIPHQRPGKRLLRPPAAGTKGLYL